MQFPHAILAPLAVAGLLALSPLRAPGQTTPVADSGITTPETKAPASEPGAEPIDKRIFGVLPNYRTADGNVVFVPLTTKQKFTIAVKDSFDGTVVGLAGGFALLYQAQNAHRNFGQGMKGFAQYFAAAYGDQVIGNAMTEAIFPSLLKEDPRYFRQGHGSVGHRIGYALTRVLITKTDAGGARFNFSEVVGNTVTAYIGNAYYPLERKFSDNANRAVTAIGTDAIADVLKEFWPDVKNLIFRKHKTAAVNP